jgi:hypothetical protein
MTTTSSTKPDQIQDLLELLSTRPSTRSTKWWAFIDKTDIRLWSIAIVAFAGAAVVAAYRSWFDARSQWSFHPANSVRRPLFCAKSMASSKDFFVR